MELHTQMASVPLKELRVSLVDCMKTPTGLTGDLKEEEEEDGDEEELRGTYGFAEVYFQ